MNMMYYHGKCTKNKIVCRATSACEDDDYLLSVPAAGHQAASLGHPLSVIASQICLCLFPAIPCFLPPRPLILFLCLRSPKHF